MSKIDLDRTKFVWPGKYNDISDFVTCRWDSGRPTETERKHRLGGHDRPLYRQGLAT